MIDEEVDRTIRAALDNRLREASLRMESNPVEAVRARVSQRRRRRCGAGAIAAAAVVFAGIAIVLTIRDGTEDLETAGPRSSAENMDGDISDDFRDGVEEPYEGLDEDSLLAETEVESQSYRMSVQTESDDQVEVSRYCIRDRRRRVRDSAGHIRVHGRARRCRTAAGVCRLPGLGRDRHHSDHVGRRNHRAGPGRAAGFR